MLMLFLILLLLVFIGIPIAIALATPSRLLPFYLLWLAMLSVFAWLWPSGPDHSSPFSGIGDEVIMMYLGSLAAIVFLKLGVARAFRPSCGETVSRSGEPEGFGLVLAGITGLLAAPWSMFLLAILLSAGSSAALAHGSMLLVPVAAVALARRSRKSGDVPMQTFADTMAVSTAITLVAVGIFVMSRINAVVDSAEKIADANPYCIHIATERGSYRPAAARLDLSPLMMRARCSHGWCFTHHGMLVVDGAWPARWSYRYREFRRDGYGTIGPLVACPPSHGFAKNLPLL